MKLNTTSAPVEVVGNTSNSNFSIAVNGKAFRVLSDTLYKNKIGSIVREISCNAYDAHVMAGKKDVPFTVHLPDDFEPWFSVQDQGVGLSPDDIANVFTVYFQSTKDQSNDAIGAFGLGAKTPFSYTDQFTVTSVKDGMKRMYSAYITPEGIPNIAEMHAEETTEENGVEIRMAVKREDYAKFKQEVATQLRYFKIKPVIENATVNFDEDTQPLFELDGFNVYPRGGYSRDAAFVILQGNVGYDLDWNNVRTSISAEARLFGDRLTSYKTILEFDIGKIGVTASREGVEYDNTTLQNINDRLVDAQKKCTEFIADKITHFETDFEKAEFIHSNDVYSKLSNYKFNNDFMVYNQGASATIKLDHKLTGGITAYQKTNSKLRRQYAGSNPIVYLNRLRKTAMVIKDNDTVGRLNQRISEVTENYGQTFLFVPTEDETVESIIEGITKLQGGYSANIKLASKIALPKIRRGEYKPSTFYKAGLNDSSLRSWGKVDNSTIEEISEETLYTTSFGMDFEDALSIGEYRALKRIESSVPDLICIKKSDTEKAEKNENLTPLKDYITEKRKEFSAKLDNGLRKKYVRYGFAETAKNWIPYRLQGLRTVMNQWANGSDISTILNIIAQPDPKKLTDAERNLCIFMGLDTERHDFIQKRHRRFERIANKLDKKYPLLKPVLDHYQLEHKQKAVAQYINMVYNDSVS